MKDEKILQELMKKAEKKFLDDELMTDEELDQVAGGTIRESVNDSECLSLFGLTKDYYKIELTNIFNGDSNLEKIKQGWARVGVNVVQHYAEDNEYYIDGKSVTQNQAWRHVFELSKSTGVLGKLPDGI